MTPISCQGISQKINKKGTSVKMYLEGFRNVSQWHEVRFPVQQKLLLEPKDQQMIFR